MSSFTTLKVRKESECRSGLPAKPHITERLAGVSVAIRQKCTLKDCYRWPVSKESCVGKRLGRCVTVTDLTDKRGRWVCWPAVGEIQEVDLDVLLGDTSEGKSLKGSRVKPAGCVWRWQGDGSGGSSEHIDEGGGGWRRVEKGAGACGEYAFCCGAAQPDINS